MPSVELPETERLRAEVEAMRYVLHALIDAHPNPGRLVRIWRRLSHDAIERSRAPASHLVRTYNDHLFPALDYWSNLIHATESADRADPPPAP